jgi:deoxyribodipyrimidine photo-lyase
LFKPWEAPKEILEKARIILGTTYPKPIVDINISRKKALDAYKRVSSSQISKAKDVVET